MSGGAEKEAQTAAAAGPAGNAGADGDRPCEQVMLPADALDRFATSFERAARRWEFIAYPALMVLVVLLAYGFFLIYSLTNDIKTIAERFDPQMGEHMERMTASVDQLNRTIGVMNKQVTVMTADASAMLDQMVVMNERINTMTDNTSAMSEQMVYLEHMQDIHNEMTAMNQKISFMTADMGRLRYDMSVMNQSVSRPMSFMNSFMPW